MRSTQATLPRARPVRAWRLSRTTVSLVVLPGKKPSAAAGSRVNPVPYPVPGTPRNSKRNSTPSAKTSGFCETTCARSWSSTGRPTAEDL